MSLLSEMVEPPVVEVCAFCGDDFDYDTRDKCSQCGKPCCVFCLVVFCLAGEICPECCEKNGFSSVQPENVPPGSP